MLGNLKEPIPGVVVLSCALCLASCTLEAVARKLVRSRIHGNFRNASNRVPSPPTVRTIAQS